MYINGEKLDNSVTVLQCKSKERNNNVTVLNNVARQDKFSRKQRKTEYIADKLVEKFKAPGWRKFFLKVAWHLSEDAIWRTYEMANTAKVKRRLNYFIAACNLQMQK